MAKIKNWSRLEYLENQDTPYIWENDQNGAEVVIGNTSKGYRVQYPTGKMRTYSKKEKARKKAVSWMKSHPNA